MINELFEIANFRKDRSKLQVNLWLDSLDNSRNVRHNSARVKIQNNKSNNFTGRKDLRFQSRVFHNPKVLLKDYKDKIKISEKDLNKMLEFIAENYFILMKHWNKEIDDFEVLNELNSKVNGKYI